MFDKARLVGAAWLRDRGKLRRYRRLRRALRSTVPLEIPAGEAGDVIVAGELERIAKDFGESVYFTRVADQPRKFLFPFVAKAADWIRKGQRTDARILDLCGGCGNLGLELSRYGFRDYELADIDEIRMRWAELLWLRFGLPLRWSRQDALRTGYPDGRFDVVALLGWESAALPYSYTLKECHRVLAPGGIILFNYHHADEIIEGNWDFDPRRRYSYLPYAISRRPLEMLVDRLGFDWMREEISGHRAVAEPFFPDARPRALPQYLVAARKR